MSPPATTPALAAAFALSLPALAQADGPSRSALELRALAGYGGMVAPSVSHERELWARNGGAMLSATLLYRSTLPLSPFVELGYAELYASRERVDTAELGALDAESSLATVSFVGGPALDLGLFRLRGGIGLYRMLVESTVRGVTIHTAENDLGWFASVGGDAYRTERFRLGLELRALLVSEAGTACLGVGLTAAGDALVW
ncbi:MAG: hypothetical protein HY908_37010 [Myxococcales bacterium]|nr:hypothetical protein [Myxococcales bacterium]